MVNKVLCAMYEPKESLC